MGSPRCHFVTDSRGCQPPWNITSNDVIYILRETLLNFLLYAVLRNFDFPCGIISKYIQENCVICKFCIRIIIRMASRRELGVSRVGVIQLSPRIDINNPELGAPSLQLT